MDYQKHIRRNAEAQTPGYTAFRLHRAVAAHFNFKSKGYDIFLHHGRMGSNRMEDYAKQKPVVASYYVELERRLLAPGPLMGFYVVNFRRDATRFIGDVVSDEACHLRYRQWKAATASMREHVRSQLAPLGADLWSGSTGGRAPRLFDRWLAGKVSDDAICVFDQMHGVRARWSTETWTALHPKWKQFDFLIKQMTPFLVVKDASSYDSTWAELGHTPLTLESTDGR